MGIKKVGVVLVSMVLVLVMLSGISSAAPSSLRVKLNGVGISFPDAQPYVDKNNRVQVPVRFVSEALGAKVGWASKTQEVTIELDGTKLVLTIGKKSYKINESTKLMDTAALRKSNRTFVPLRFVSEGLGAKVKWDSANYTVEITTGDGTTASSGETDENPALKPVDQETWEASRSMEGKTDKRTTEGFSYYSIYKSGLSPGTTHYKKEYGNTRTILSILLTMDNLDAQAKDLDELLRQKIDGKTVDEVTKYVRQKKNQEDVLSEKVFKDDTYKIVVESKEWLDVNIEVWYK
ncbi:copper amine oxidase N-terminal domain-containing protein [Paenibacillus lutimineralis]|uniref:Copper amine oxidase N-terminal domain-containing protein n=1 Tax=Paenibacillus lutimineralis TaxID=2707005 RepID=A0A3S9UUP5_9BACL|nr:copper amine oxidase N-terminal domain-containing protein [Paenibacillus lutimineralis]AZS14042.1 copper amine oxidase N-terminal domain-containing protein [Paenibacillus lutimineralis]